MAAAPEWKWKFPPQDKYYRPRPWSSTTSSSSSSSSEDEGEDDDGDASSDVDDDDYYEDSEEYDENEPPHPLGFESYPNGRTRYGLSTASKGSGDGWSAFDDTGNDTAWNSLIHIDDGRRVGYECDSRVGGGANATITTTLPVRSYNLDLRGTRFCVPDALSRIAMPPPSAGKDDEYDDVDIELEGMRCGMDRIARLVAAAGLVARDDCYDDYDGTTDLTTTTTTAHRPRSASRLLELASACEIMESNVPSEMDALETESRLTYDESCRGLLLLLRADDEMANAAKRRIGDRRRYLEDMEERDRLIDIERDEARRIESEERMRQTVERENDERTRLEEARQKEERRKVAKENAIREAEAEEAKSIEHVHRAIDLVSRVDDVRSTLRAFETSTAVGKRRLQFKKVVNGKINTLAHDIGKVMEVSNAVINAIDQASRDDDDAANSRAGGGGGGGIDQASTMGRRYLLDLLCSNLIVRVQADGFNGTRGDGYPLASTFAHVSVRCPEICHLLEGHLYRVCPTAVPALSLTMARDRGGDGTDNASGGGNDDATISAGEDLMESLGMIRDRDGEFESFDKFLHRTEVSLSIYFTCCLGFSSISVSSGPSPSPPTPILYLRFVFYPHRPRSTSHDDEKKNIVPRDSFP